MTFKAVILGEQGIKDILIARGVDPEKLPAIRANDPRISSLGAKPGDIVGFDQKNDRCAYYRVVEEK